MNINLLNQAYNEIRKRTCDHFRITRLQITYGQCFGLEFEWMGTRYRSMAEGLPNQEAAQVRFITKEILRVILKTEIE